MDCPFCGKPIGSGELSCHYCGKSFAGIPLALKDFLQKDDANKGLRTGINVCWISLLILGGVTLILQLVAKLPPLDAVAIGALAICMGKTYSKASAVTTLVYGILNVLIHLIFTGTFSGYLYLILGIIATVLIGKASDRHRAYLSSLSPKVCAPVAVPSVVSQNDEEDAPEEPLM